MNKLLDETKIYKRMVAALTQRQLILSAKVSKPRRKKYKQSSDPNSIISTMSLEPLAKKFAQIDKETKSLINNKDPNSILTTMVVAKETMPPVYAFSIIPDGPLSLPTARNGATNIKYHYKDSNESPLAYNPPYGTLPQMVSLAPEELMQMANHFSILKYQYMERGDYWHAWLFGWRQRMIERILSGVVSLTVTTDV